MTYFFSIRHAETREAPNLAKLGYLAWEQSILPLGRESAHSRDELMARMADYCSDRLDDIIVAQSNFELLGWCSRFPGKAYIPYLFVAPLAQRHGVGGLLLRRMESLFELEGKHTVQLETPADHVEAVRFYEKQGYHILAMKQAGRSAHKPYQSVRLEKRLHPFIDATEI